MPLPDISDGGTLFLMGELPACVLLVDDDPDLRETMCDVLAEQELSVVCSRHGAEALEYLRRTPFKPRVILLDLMMPTMNGWEFRSQQLADPRIADIPVIVLTAAANVDHVDGAPVVKKPLRLLPFLDILGRILAPQAQSASAG